MVTVYNRLARTRSTARASLAMATSLLIAVTGLTLATASPAVAAPVLEHVVSSPDGKLDASVGLDNGRLTYAVSRDETTSVVAPSGLGFVLKNPAADLTSGIEIIDTTTDVIDERWTPSWGTVSSVRNHANELTVHAKHGASGVLFDVTFRVFDDGVGFRYTFPEQAALAAPFTIASESTQFSLPVDLTAYSIPAGTRWDADEKHYSTKNITEVANAQTPITFSRASDGLYIALHEADLTDYPSMTVVKDASASGRLVSDLIALPGAAKDRAIIDATDGGFDTPWRSLTITRSAGDLAESHLVLNLNDACAICDVDSDGDGVDDTADWIDPGTYTGVWWELQRRATTWNAGPNHGATTARVKDYIDLAAEAGAKSVLVEGWNKNAGNTWENQDFLTPMDDFDLEEVLAYAESKGIGYTMHNETRGYVDYYDQHMEEIFSQYEEWGVHSIKTGYATRFDLGGVARSHYDQEAVKHYQRVIDAAASHKIVINAHEAIKPTGKERTYPNMMSGEGVAGMEQQNYMGSNGNPPAQATILPFTRWIGGPADYTPGVLNVTWDPANLKTYVQTTTTAQLALYTVFYSPLQMLADTPENYALHSEAFEYLKDMPTTWDESEVDAEIGDYVVTSRRSGDVWYTGAIVDEVDRSIPIKLDFLTPGTSYVADMYADAADASWKGNPTSVEVTRSIVTYDDVVVADVVGAGGQAYRFEPATPEEIAALAEFDSKGIEYGSDFSTSFNAEANEATITGTVTNGGTLVGQHNVVLTVDGKEVAAKALRIAGSDTADVTFVVDYDFAAHPLHKLSLGDGESASGATVEVRLAPSFADAEVGIVQALITEAAVSGELAQTLGQQARIARQLFARGDRGEVTQRIQAMRIALYLAPAKEVTTEARAELDSLFTETLGAPIGLVAALEPLVNLEDSLTGTAIDNVRSKSREAITAGVGGYTARTATLRAEIASLLTGAPGATATQMRDAFAALDKTVRVEAETATRSGATATSTEHPGYTGTGFIKSFSALGSGISFTVASGLSGEYDVSVRYANGMIIAPLDRQLTFIANGSSDVVAFANRGQDANRWRNWGTAPGPRFSAASGSNAFELVWATGDTGNVNVDSFLFTPASGIIERPRFEAETATRQNACAATTVAGFTGAGYVQCFTTGSTVDFDVRVPVSGDYIVTANYATATAADQVARVKVGDGSPVDIALPGSTSWSQRGVVVSLKAGENRVRFASESIDLRLDSLSVTGVPRVAEVAVTISPETPGEADWYTEAVEVDLELVGGDGDASIEYSLDDGAWTSYAGAISIGDDGRHELRHRVVVSGEPAAPVAVAIAVDLTAPVSAATVDEQARTVTVRSADSTSGLALTEVNIDGAGWVAYDGPVEVGAEQSTVKFRGTDKAGNVEAAGVAVVPAAGIALADTLTASNILKSSVRYMDTNSVTVRVAGSGGTPTGTVQVSQGAVLVGSATLSTLGRATVTLDPALVLPGTQSLSVRYSGDAAFAASEDEVSVSVSKAAVTVKASFVKAKISKSSYPKVYVRLTSKAPITGTVTIKEGSKVYRADVAVVNGVQVIKLPKLKKGTHKIVVSYSGSTTTDSARISKSIKIVVK